MVEQCGQMVRVGVCWLAIGVLWATSSIAQAQSQDDYMCQRIQARAESDAYLLFSPRVTVQGLHVPLVGDDTGAGLYSGSGWQVRAALSVSFVNMLRGAWTLDAAEHRCQQQRARREVLETLEMGNDYGRRGALQAQLRFLESQADALQALLSRADRRVEEGLLTLPQRHTLALRVRRMERSRASIRAELARQEASNEPSDSARPVEDEGDEESLSASLLRYERESLAVERQQADLRRLSPWRVSFRGGVIPIEPADFFGVLELSYNVGGIAQHMAEDRYLEARENELRHANYELRGRVERFERFMRTSVDELEESLRLLDAQLELVDEQLGLLTRVREETRGVEQSIAMLQLNRIELSAQRIFERRLLEERRGIAGGTQ